MFTSHRELFVHFFAGTLFILYTLIINIYQIKKKKYSSKRLGKKKMKPECSGFYYDVHTD